MGLLLRGGVPPSLVHAAALGLHPHHHPSHSEQESPPPGSEVPSPTVFGVAVPSRSSISIASSVVTSSSSLCFFSAGERASITGKSWSGNVKNTPPDTRPDSQPSKPSLPNGCQSHQPKHRPYLPACRQFSKKRSR